MIYENDYGRVDFFPSDTILDNKMKIGINLSGGADSALVLYMLANESINKKFHIIPITGIDIKRPTNIWNAREIVDLIQEKFPKSKIKGHEENRYEKEHEKDKSNHHGDHERRLFRSGKVDLIVHCRTSNPPIEVARENNLLEKREEIRDHDQQKSLFPGNKKYYCPALIEQTQDTTGCGDAYFSITTLLRMINYSGKKINFIGNSYAALHSQTVGNKKIYNKNELLNYVRSITNY